VTDAATFHEASGTVRFWVTVGDQEVGAIVGRETLHYRYHPTMQDDLPLTTFADHEQELHDAVRRRVAGGAVEPVMLRDGDIRLP
jgi:homospermidine synthase